MYSTFINMWEFNEMRATIKNGGYGGFGVLVGEGKRGGRGRESEARNNISHGGFRAQAIEGLATMI